MADEGLTDYKAQLRLIEKARVLFEERVYRVGFPEALRVFSNATSIEASKNYKIGFVAADLVKEPPGGEQVAAKTGVGHNYVHVYCQKSPPDEVTAVSGWTKINEEGFWSFNPDTLNVSSTSPNDREPIHVCFEAAENVELEAIVGRCMWARASAVKSSQLTQGLVIRTANGNKWAVTVGHGFNGGAPTHADNAVKFCALAPPPPNSGPNVLAQECANCRANECNSACMDALAGTRVTVSEGLANIVTFNPKEEELDSLDFGVYKIPDHNNGIRFSTLVVRQVLAIAGQIRNDNPDAYDEIAGPSNGVESVGTDISPPNYAAWLLFARTELEQKGVVLFKRGKKTGWTFARLLAVTDTEIQATCIGRKPGHGDCGAIWWIIDAYERKASPIGYHRGRRNGTVALIVPYLTALGRLAERDARFNGYQFVAGDSYTWA